MQKQVFNASSTAGCSGKHKANGQRLTANGQKPFDLTTGIQNFLSGELERQKAFGFHELIHGFIPVPVRTGRDLSQKGGAA